MAWTKGQCAAAGAGEHELVDTEARHLEPRDRPGIGPRPGFDFFAPLRVLSHDLRMRCCANWALARMYAPWPSCHRPAIVNSPAIQSSVLYFMVCTSVP